MPQIRYTFVASGADAVASAFASIDRAAGQSAKKVSASYTQSEASAKKASTASITAREKAEAKWSSAAQKSADKTAKAEQRAAEQSARAQIKAREHVFQVRARYDAAETKAAEKKAAAEARAAERASSSRMRALGSLGKDALLGGGAAAIGVSTAVVGAAARESIKLGEIANRFAINAKLAGQNVSANQAKQNFEQVAIATPGVKSEDIGEAALAFQSKTGRSLGKGELSTLATAASASGGQVQDIAAAAASLGEKFDIKKVEDLQSALAALIDQGAKGSFELKDAAGQFEALSAAASRFGLNKGVQSVKTLGGLTQMARASTGSAEEASTAVQAMFSQLILKSGDLSKGKFGGAKINVFDKKGQSQDITKLLPEIIAKVGGKDMQKKMTGLAEIFDARGIKAISPLIEAFAAATKDGKDGMAAMQAVISKNIDTTASWATVQGAAAASQKDASAQLSVAWEQIKASVSAQVVPALLQLVPQVLALLPAIQPLIGAFGVLAEGAVKVAGILGIKAPEKSKMQIFKDKEQAYKIAKDEVTQAAAARNSLPTAEENAKLKKLRGEKDAAEGLAFVDSKANKGLSEEEFIKKFNATTPGESTGKAMAKQISENPNDRMPFFASDEQKQLIQQRRDQVTYERTTKQDTGADDAAKAMKESANAMRDAAKELRTVKGTGTVTIAGGTAG